MGRQGDYGQYGQQQDPGRVPPSAPPQWGQGPPPGYRPPPWPPQYPPDGTRPPQPPRGYRPPQEAAWQQPYQPRYAPRPAPRRKRRVFLWVFLGIQALFIIWLATGIAGTSHSGTSAHAQAVTFCADKANWQYLYKSQADCTTHYGNALNGASDVGKSLGAGIIIAAWVVADTILGISYGVYRLATRPR